MRILPLVYYFHYKGITDDKVIREMTDKVSGLTHGHNISKMACFMYVKYCLYLLDGMNKYEAYESIKKEDYSSYGEAIDVYNRVLNNDISILKLEDISSSGYVVDTWEAVLWMLLNTNSYKQAIIGCINLGNDTDTIAAICGSLAGIIYGYNNIPHEWINGLIRLDYLIELIEKFESCLLK